jgi:hypothetical protein
VPDASVLIDFKRGGLLAPLLALPYRWLLPDLTLAELKDPTPEVLFSLGLRTATFDGQEIVTIIQVREKYKALSLPDCAALYLAHRERALLLTGDGLLRRVAANDFHLRVHGTLWALDRLVEAGAITGLQASQALRLMLDAGSRLPPAECQKRLRQWEGK